VIDWDFFFVTPEPGHAPMEEWSYYDWGHREASFFIQNVWVHRGASFLAAGKDLPMPNAAWRTFWDRVTLSPDADLYYADSNTHALDQRVLSSATSLLLLDAHHDSGYDAKDKRLLVLRTARYTCENWMLVPWRMGVGMAMRYPTWRWYAAHLEPTPLIPISRVVDDGASHLGQFDKVFVCRSGAWVPPWCDDAFADFLQIAPVRSWTLVSDQDWTRENDVTAMEDAAAQLREMRRMMDEAKGATK
jgi:hypothetical protein